MATSKELQNVTTLFDEKKRLSYEDDNFGRYAPTYLHTNENLRDYMTDLKGKDILTVTSSGEQALNAIFQGANTVDTFDINAYAPLVQKLKLGAIEGLLPELAFQFLNSQTEYLYRKFRYALPDKTLQFFDYLYENYSQESIERYFYKPTSFRKSFEVNLYETPEDISTIKNNIPSTNMRHYSTDIYNLPLLLNKKYDAIYLSNISTYLKDWHEFLDFIRKLSDFLKDDGSIYYAYFYRQLHSMPLKDVIRYSMVEKNAYEILKEYLDILERTELLEIDSPFLYDDRLRDKVLVYRKGGIK